MKRRKLESIGSKITKVNTARNMAAPAVSRVAGRPGARMRERILKRDDYLCQPCLRMDRVSAADEVDHIVPLHVGGSNADENQEAICRECHRTKSRSEGQSRDGAGSWGGGR